MGESSLASWPMKVLRRHSLLMPSGGRAELLARWPGNAGLYGPGANPRLRIWAEGYIIPGYIGLVVLVRHRVTLLEG